MRTYHDTASFDDIPWDRLHEQLRYSPLDRHDELLFHSRDQRQLPPLAGFIYLCEARERSHFICKRRFILLHDTRRYKGNYHSKGVDSTRVRPGTKLFIFDRRTRLLSGNIYEVTTFPHLVKGFATDHADSEQQELLCKIYFQIYERHEPLEERIFRSAIEGNYFMPNRFHTGLSGDQVKALLDIYHFPLYRQCVIFHNNLPERELHTSLASSRRATSNLQHFKHHRLLIGSNTCVTGANAIPVNPRKKKKWPAEFSLYNLEPARLDYSVHNLAQINDTGYIDHTDSLKDQEAQSPATRRSLEDGEFVAPETCDVEIHDSSITGNFGNIPNSGNKALMKEPDCIKIKTRNFIGMLEDSVMSTSDDESAIHSTISAGQNIHEDGADSWPAGPLHKDQKVKPSVWLRLSSETKSRSWRSERLC